MALSGSSGGESEERTYGDYMEDQIPHVPALKRALISELGPEYSDKLFLDATSTEYNRGTIYARGGYKKTWDGEPDRSPGFMNKRFHQLVFGFKGNGDYGLHIWGKKPGVDLPLFAVLLAESNKFKASCTMRWTGL
jgi:hypothetical protein